MGFRDLFINDENKKEEKKVETNSTTQTEFTSKFPSSGPVETKQTAVAAPVVAAPPTQMAPITPDNPACAPHLDKIMKLYEDGFNSLNMDGYDFFEFFQGIVQAKAINNAPMYGMALTMANTADASVTKETLIQQAQYYIDEINKVHKHYVDNGNLKREGALKAKGQEEASLTKELGQINAEILRLTQLKSQKESELAAIDGKYVPQITDVECKLMANDMARERILATINSVLTGIKNNL